MSFMSSKNIELIKLSFRERLSVGQLLQFQEKALRDIISYAYDHVPYYQDLFDRNGLRPMDIRTLDDIRKIPVLTKESIRKNFKDMVATGCHTAGEGITYVSTTGSSGMPLKVALSTEEMARSYLFLYYGYLKSGIRPFSKIAYIKAQAGSENGISARSFGTLKEYDIDLRAGPQDNICELNRLRPQHIYSYPSYLSLLAKFILENDAELLFRPRSILTNGEVLTDNVRGSISGVFRCPVKDTYGSAEIFRTAFECKSGNLHIIPDSVIVEIEDDGSGGPLEGEAIITSLYHRTMPLIRYKIGDRLSLSREKCACGLNFTIIKSILGRSDDILALPSGRTISARAINLLDDIPGIIEYQIIQKELDYFEVIVRPDSKFSDESDKCIKNIIRAGCHGEDIKISVIMTTEIKRASTGKLRAVISEVGRS
jgi:phenylacetate-CoA ligase